MKPEETQSKPEDFFTVRIGAIPTNHPLQFDVYLSVGGKPVLFRKRGDALTEDRIDQLKRHAAQDFLIPTEQREVFMSSLKEVLGNPEIETNEKSKVLKETAFIHVHDLFTKRNISPAIQESKNLVEEMVNFISTDLTAATSLMRLSVHDYYTYNHCVDVAVYSIALARRILGEDKETLLIAGMAGLLHDVGKRKIDYDIINKDSPLSPEEWEEIKKHPDYGKEYLKDIKSVHPDSKTAVHEHHENFDGTGYPQGLKGDDIAKLSRIVTIADVFDALTTNRSYHNAIKPQEALKVMFSMQPGKFDPSIFKSFNKDFDKKSPIGELSADFDPCQTPPDWKKVS